MPEMWFHRGYRGFTGGHLKVWNYFQHVEAAGWAARIYFSPDSVWDGGNPWQARRSQAEPVWRPEQADALFLGGYDWRMVPVAERAHYPKPVINLIQHVHHADPAHPLSGFLKHHAIRVCVSPEVQQAIEATGRVCGPSFVIPNGIAYGDLPPTLPQAERPVDWLVCGLKEDRPKLARALAEQLRREGDWGQVETATKLLPRAEFLLALSRAKNVVLLPRQTEGFYLPALEAMALGALVICPDCVGNRSFCRNGFNSLISADASVDALLASMRGSRGTGFRREILLEQGFNTAREHSVARERAAFHAILDKLPALWAER